MAGEQRPSRYLEDFAIGQRFVTGTVVVDADEIKSFAARFDPQPFHLDEAAATQSLFGGLVASGWHTAAMAMRLLVESDLRIEGGLVGVGGEITWPQPTKPGDLLHVEGEVIDVTPSRSKPAGIVKIRAETRNQHGEIVQTAIMKLLVPRQLAPIA
jgi:acyl dehydratase